jgi:hypothetical protein
MRLVMKLPQHIVYGKVVRAGEEFEVPDNEGRTWLLLNLASEVPAAPRRRGRYSRGDMRAEDSDENSGL